MYAMAHMLPARTRTVGGGRWGTEGVVVVGILIVGYKPRIHHDPRMKVTKGRVSTHSMALVALVKIAVVKIWR